jgi:hypothetical protein
MPRTGQLYFYLSPCGIRPRNFRKGDVLDEINFRFHNFFPSRLEARLGRVL